MANFLMPKRTVVKDEANVDADVTLVGAVAVDRGPIGDVATGDAGAPVVATNYGDSSISLLNVHSLAVECNVAVDGEPFAVVISDDRAYVSTSSAGHDAVNVVDTNTKTVIATYPLAFSVTALAISPDGKRVYAGRTGRDHIDVAVIDTTAERVGTIDITTGAGIGIDAVVVDPTGKRLYVGTTDDRDSRLVVVDTETARVDRAVRIGSPIRDLAFSDGTVYALTSDRVRGGAVWVVDMSVGAITDIVELGGAPTQMTLSPDGTHAYIVDYDHVAVLCTLSLEVVNSITIDARPSCVAVSSEGDRLAIADYAGGVTVFTIASSMPMLYSQFIATSPLALRELHETEPASA
jgi:DNA-binding beta-propeller fold protein YncE